MKTREQIKEQYHRLFNKAYDYYGNRPRRNNFLSLICLLAARRLHPSAFKHPETTWKECWDWAFNDD